MTWRNTFLHQWPPSCTSNYLPALAATSSAATATFLHQQPPSCTSSYQSCTSNHLSAASATKPAPAITFQQQQQPSCTSRYQTCTSYYPPAPATTSPGPATTFLHQRLPSCTSSYQSYDNSYQSCTSDHRSWLPDFHQQSSPVPATSSCTNYQFLDFSNRHPPYDSRLRFAIIKFGPSKQPPCFGILA